ncbi:MAG: acyl-CoA dehydrogenase [Thermodesulfobacteriota bacterium]|nr:acyl-CoA dehydrogenase [Thermodesulfobacteriota bacterium]
MANLILDERDQHFLLYEMLEAEKLCENPLYTDFSKDIFDMILTEAQKFAVEEVFPTLVEGDKEGCRLEDGQVYVPKAFHRVYKLFCQGGWGAMSFPPEMGGQGLPIVIRTAGQEWFMHNFALLSYPGLTEGAAHLIAVFGTDEQRQKYMEKMITGEWSGTMALTEPNAGTDVGNVSTKAIRQPDGTFRLQGTKIFITSADQDLTENIIHPVLARIEGDPAGTKGISIFLVPKYIVNDDGTLGKRNDYEIANIEEKMGIHGSSTCLINFGDNNECYAELLGEERQGMKVMFQMMNEARIGVGMQGLGSASIAYLHALQYAKERLQGSSIENFKNPEAPKVPIIKHPDVRRMLLWMKSSVDSMRALMYFASYCVDKSMTSGDETEKEKWEGFLEILTPICKAYSTDIGFRVTEQAIQVYGGYGYCAEYPVEQFMRDEKIASLYEGTNGIQALDLVGRKLGMKKGAYFMNLLVETGNTIAKYKDTDGLSDLAADMQGSVNLLGEAALFFGKCGKEGKYLIPVGNAYPFLMMMGKVVSGWFLLWQAGIAKEKLDALCKESGIGAKDKEALTAFVKDNRDAAFYSGKLSSARYFIKNVLPEVDAAVKAIKSEDLSIMEIEDESFA